MHTSSSPLRLRPATRLRALAVVSMLVLGLVGSACADDNARPTLNTEVTVPAGAAPVEAPGTSLVATASTVGDLEFRAGPDAGAEVVATLPNPRPLDTDPPVSIPLVMLVADQVDGWVQVYLPIRPNGSTGWIQSDAVDLTTHPWRIEALLDDFTLKVYKNDVVVFETDIGVARENAPTPGGLYYTTELLKPPDASTVYGTYAYGLSGFSEVFESFNGGPGQLGIHGTNEPDLIGQQVSAGCIRLRNSDIDYIVEVLGLPLGVPVSIVTNSVPAA
jgi:lipoprotein-anchoring transpeptidase ErfK/SrfK